MAFPVAVQKEPNDNKPASSRLAETTPSQFFLLTLGAIAFLYFARPVAMPIFLACIAGMTLKPLIRWFSCFHIPKAFSAAVVISLLVVITGVGFFGLVQPALEWMNKAPQHMSNLRRRVQKLSPGLSRLNLAAEAVTDLGATEAEKKAEQKKFPTVMLKENRGANSILNWTGTLLMGASETLVLLYLLLASGDLFTKKLVHVMPTLTDKKHVVEVSREIEQQISKYLLSVSIINVGLGLTVAAGLHFMGVPNPPMWGMVVAVLNYVPYFGPFVGVVLLFIVGLLTFDILWMVLLPTGWYLLLHLIEANLITPVLIGRRFSLNPVVIFISLIFWTWLWGVPGALMSVPILVSIKVICDRIPRLSLVSELLAR